MEQTWLSPQTPNCSQHLMQTELAHLWLDLHRGRNSVKDGTPESKGGGGWMGEKERDNLKVNLNSNFKSLFFKFKVSRI